MYGHTVLSITIIRRDIYVELPILMVACEAALDVVDSLS